MEVLREENPNEEIVAVVNGDIIQGSHEKDGQLVTPRLSIQSNAMLKCLQMLRARVDRMYLMHGTAWHGGPASEHFRGAAEALDVVRSEGAGSPFWWQLFLDIDGHVTHWTHHISAGSRPALQGTAPLQGFLDLEMELLRVYGPLAPGIVLGVRSHRHWSIYLHKPPHIHCLVLPCWQLKGEFVFRLGAATLPDIGYGIVRVQGGEIVARPRVFPLPPLHIERGRVA